MLQPLFDIVRPYWPTLLFFVVFPVLAAIANWLLWWDTPERWEAFAAKHPEKARYIRILRAVAPHLRKLLTVARDGVASKGAPQAVVLLSPPVVVVAEKAGAVAVSETRGGFDPTAHIRRDELPPVDGRRGFAAVRALLAIVVTLAVVVPVGVALTGCPRLPPVSGCNPMAQACINDRPHVCSASQRWQPAGDLACSAVRGVCAVADGRAYCAPMTDGGAR